MTITEIKSIEDINSIKDIRTYLPLMEKELIINNIVNSIIDIDENNIANVDYIHLDFFIDIEMLKGYFNIEIPQDIDIKVLIDTYDYLCNEDIISQLKTRVCDDFDYLMELMNKTISQKVENSNSLSAVLAKTLNKIVSSLPDEKGMQKIINSIPKAINKIDKENLSAITSALGGKKE